MTPDQDNSPARSGVLPFLIDAGPRQVLMGRFVRVDDVASTILGRHDYPLSVAELCAETVALAACLASTMDYDGVFTLQASGDGPVKTLFADVTSQGAVRAYSSHDENMTNTSLGAPAAIISLMGSGYLAFTVDQGEQGRYQGIVPIEAPDLRSVSMRYFRDSEQIDTALIIAARPDGNAGWQASALLLQRIPETGGSGKPGQGDADLWHTACALMATCTREEMLDPRLSPEDLLYRLFNELDVRVQPFRPLKDECRCSPERVERMLAALPDDEKHSLSDDGHRIMISCEFCKKEHIHQLP
ncbi:MAG: Hsp33 family molecular chaperone HslO [Candidatus Puniceispirillales bacterium]